MSALLSELWRFSQRIVYLPYNALPYLLLALAVLWAVYPLRRKSLKKNGLRAGTGHEVVLHLLVIWAVLMVYLTVDLLSRWKLSLQNGWPLPAIPWFQASVNLVPWVLPENRWEWVMLGGNIALFLPLGLLLPLGWRGWRVRRVALVGLVVSLAIELLQFALGGAGRAFDAQDLLLNTLGTGLGGWLGGRLPWTWQVQAVDK